jgi:hypothetical protein
MISTDATLTKAEKNAALKALSGLNLDPGEFEWTENEKQELPGMTSPYYRRSILTHRPTRYYFIFGGAKSEFSPGVTSKVQSEVHENDLSTRKNCLAVWLQRLSEEIDAPDLWASIGKEKVLSNAASSSDLENKPFNADEQKLIALKLDEIRKFVLEDQAFDAEHAEKIEREFSYLKESSQRLGRKDWLNVLLGGLFGLMLTLPLEPEKARGLLALAGTLLQSLWHVTKLYLQ